MSTSTFLYTKTILVAETQPFLRSIIIDILRNAGITKIKTAGSCPEAKIQITTFLPDAIVMDWSLKGGTGAELVNWIRNSKQSPNTQIPIAIITEGGAKEEILLARDRGVDEIIIKPVVPKILLSRVNLLFTAKRAFVKNHTFVGPDRRRKINQQFKGPNRRQENSSQITGLGANPQILNQCKTIQQSLNGLDVHDRDSVMALYQQSQKLWNEAISIGNDPLEEITRSMFTYIQAMGISGNLERDIVTKHLQAVQKLKNMEQENNTQPTQLLNELKSLIATQPPTRQVA